mmetsp:Transcript_34279/g.80767  ORF Transcript_34279/g.80767 Transcript_34279/m.80767 type:complete len:254 (+) Transcript_34279:163-924(+)
MFSAARLVLLFKNFPVVFVALSWILLGGMPLRWVFDKSPLTSLTIDRTSTPVSVRVCPKKFQFCWDESLGMRIWSSTTGLPPPSEAMNSSAERSFFSFSGGGGGGSAAEGCASSFVGCCIDGFGASTTTRGARVTTGGATVTLCCGAGAEAEAEPPVAVVRGRLDAGDSARLVPSARVVVGVPYARFEACGCGPVGCLASNLPVAGPIAPGAEPEAPGPTACFSSLVLLLLLLFLFLLLLLMLLLFLFLFLGS